MSLEEMAGKVSILGLVDKGLRLQPSPAASSAIWCFNPWFSG
mgnify:CR=1 FL=1